jgi:hypothetical protein
VLRKAPVKTLGQTTVRWRIPTENQWKSSINFGWICPQTHVRCPASASPWRHRHPASTRSRPVWKWHRSALKIHRKNH